MEDKEIGELWRALIDKSHRGSMTQSDDWIVNLIRKLVDERAKWHADHRRDGSTSSDWTQQALRDFNIDTF